MNIQRVVVWFSAGVTSAVAAKIALDEFKDQYPVHIVNCDTGSEHPDNFRFLHDVEDYLGVKVEILKNEKFKNTHEVYLDTGFIKNQYGAKCTVELKKVPRRKYENLETDLQIFGFHFGELERAKRFEENNPEINCLFPLIDFKIDHNQARQMLLMAGIQEPITYSMGFNNANCLKTGCVKGGMGYWNLYRNTFPEAYLKMAKIEREIGHAINAKEELVDGKRIKIPVYLDELKPTDGNYKSEPVIQCGLFCGEL